MGLFATLTVFGTDATSKYQKCYTHQAHTQDYLLYNKDSKNQKKSGMRPKTNWMVMTFRPSDGTAMKTDPLEDITAWQENTFKKHRL